MSSMSLEERRAERRRKREMEAESMLTKTPDEIEAEIQERLAQRRKEREDRMAAISSSLVAVNGEDDLERLRRERREARLRSRTEGSSDDSSYTSYRSRRRESEEEPSEDSYTSYRARRRRNWDNDEDTPTVNETSVPDTSAEEAVAERRRRQRQEEEEEARRQQEREEEEERRQAEEEERRRQEREEERQREREEEERRQEEEEERRRQEEEEERERQKRGKQDQFNDALEDSDEEDDDNKADHKLFIEEGSGREPNTAVNILNSKVEVSERLDRVRKWNEDSNNTNSKVSEKKGVNGNWNKENRNSASEVDESAKVLDRSSSLKEINNNKIKDKLEKFEHLKDVESGKKSTTVTTVKTVVLQNKQGLREKLQKFEQDRTGHSTAKPKKQLPEYTPPSQKLSHKLQHFETAARTQSAAKTSSRNIQFEPKRFSSNQDQRQALLGRWSASESHINKPSPVKELPTKKVLDRWKSVEQENQSVKSPTTREETSRKRLSGNVEFVTARYLEKASTSVDESIPPKSPKSPGEFKQIHVVLSSVRTTSQSSDNQSDLSGTLSPNQSRSKVTDRWQFAVEGDRGNTQGKGQGTSVAYSRGSSMDNSYIHSRGSSVDASSEKSWKNQQDQEEEERLEAARQEKLKMAEESKKRGKRKGLGGLTPEKKKKLKQIIMQKAAEDLKTEALAKAKEKEAYINEKLGVIETSGVGEAELRKLCQKLHARLAIIHSEVYDWEFKVGRQEQEISELTMKCNDSQGKFVKPVLRKVNKTTQHNKLYRYHMTIEESPQTEIYRKGERC